MHGGVEWDHAGAGALAMKFATCKEMFEGWTWGDTCAAVRAAGYDGIEIAPFTFCDDVRTLDADARANIWRTAADEGLAICGVHWLLVKPEGLQLLSLDPKVRARTVDYLVALVDMCADVAGPGSVLTFGSPNQRSIPQGMDPEEAAALLDASLRRVGDRAVERGVKFCLEPLPASMTNIMNTAAEVRSIVQRVNHPGIGMMLDVKSMCAEPQSPAEIIRDMAGFFSHFHANDANMRGPGTGDVDFVPIMKALLDVGYTGYVSVEVFDYRPDPITIARESLDYMKRCLEQARTTA